MVEVFDRMYPKLIGYTLRFTPLTIQDSEEVVQEAFLALHRHLRGGKPLATPDAWMFQVTQNLALKRALNTRREIRRLVWLERPEKELAPDPCLTPEGSLAERAARTGVAAVVMALPQLDRQCLALRSEGLRYREISEILGVSLGTVAKSLERSLERIVRVTRRYL